MAFALEKKILSNEKNSFKNEKEGIIKVLGLDGKYDEKDKERVENYFNEIAQEYPEHRPVCDSAVRIDQEKEILEKIQKGAPVLIRGNWRVGKTSMINSLKKHFENSLFIDTATDANKEESLDDFKKRFGAYAVAELFEKMETKKANSTAEDEEEIRRRIKDSKKTPFEYLNDYLSEKNEKVFLSLDEVVGFIEEPEKLKYLASLKDFSQIQIAVVLHRIASSEKMFKDIFSGYETNFIRSLTLEETKQLIHRPLEDAPINFTNEAVLKIFEFTGGRPMEINNFCRTLMDMVSEHKKYKLVYTAEDIEDIAKKEIMSPGSFLDRAVNNYKRIYQSLNEEEREIIDRLAGKNEISFSEIDENKIQPMIDLTLVIKDDKEKTYHINGEFFRQVIGKK